MTAFGVSPTCNYLARAAIEMTTGREPWLRMLDVGEHRFQSDLWTRYSRGAQSKRASGSQGFLVSVRFFLSDPKLIGAQQSRSFQARGLIKNPLERFDFLIRSVEPELLLS